MSTSIGMDVYNRGIKRCLSSLMLTSIATGTDVYLHWHSILSPLILASFFHWHGCLLPLVLLSTSSGIHVYRYRHRSLPLPVLKSSSTGIDVCLHWHGCLPQMVLMSFSVGTDVYFHFYRHWHGCLPPSVSIFLFALVLVFVVVCLFVCFPFAQPRCSP